MLATVYSTSLIGLDTHLVRVEVDISSGLPACHIVGLPDTSVQESRERVRSAIRHSGFDFPIRRITVNLSPADLRKEGPSFDLPIALAILGATEQVPPSALREFVAAGELALDGETRRIRGVLSMACDLPSLARQAGVDAFGLMVPAANGAEAAAVPLVRASLVQSLRDAVALLRGDTTERPTPSSLPVERARSAALDLADVRGQHSARRALEIAASGDHHILLAGPPGSGKTMLAQRLPTLLPELGEAEAIEVTKIYSVAGLLREDSSLLSDRPFRSPHHTISDVALIGGGRMPRPGEISLAHRGVLFLDEVTEFRRSTLEVLRQPLVDRRVHVSRVRGNACYPADALLVGTLNPCPCGFRGDPTTECSCTPRQLERYLSRLSGPLLDRIDLHVEVPRVTMKSLRSRASESSASVRERVLAARERQVRRFRGESILTNGRMDVGLLGRHCVLGPAARGMLDSVAEAFGITARTYHNILRVARTIADLAGAHDIAEEHVAEAVQLRALDQPLLLARAGEVRSRGEALPARR